MKKTVLAHRPTTQARNRELIMRYERMRAERVRVGKKTVPKYGVGQMFEKLARRFHLSERTVQDIVWGGGKSR